MVRSDTAIWVIMFSPQAPHSIEVGCIAKRVFLENRFTFIYAAREQCAPLTRGLLEVDKVALGV